MNVACVIVTYNRLDLLKKAVDAVNAQTLRPETIIVMDNHSTDGTREWLDTAVDAIPGLSPVLLDANLGGAGGFHLGLKEACERGADWVWAMDDDTIPGVDALERLVKAAEMVSTDPSVRIGFLASQVNWVDGRRHIMNVPAPDFEWWAGYDGIPGCIRLRCASFVSILVSRVAIETVGLPIKEFFIWRDDYEFTDRISRAGFSNYYVEASKVVHFTKANKGVDYINIEKKDLWKWRYGTRNHVAMEKLGPYRFVGALLLVVWITLRMIRHRVSPSIVGPIVVAAFRGLFFDYSKLIVYPSRSCSG